MKGVKVKFLKKLTSIPNRVLQAKPLDRVLQVNASDGYVDNVQRTQLVCNVKEQKSKMMSWTTATDQQEPDVIDVDELMRDLLTDEEESDREQDKENIRPTRMTEKIRVGFEDNSMRKTESKSKQSRVSNFQASEAAIIEEPEKREETPSSEIDISSFRGPDLNSATLFDPDLLAAFQQAVVEYMKLSEAQRISRLEKQHLENNEDQVEIEPEQMTRTEEKVQLLENNEQEQVQVPESNEEEDPLLAFPEKCPPGSNSSVILYTTSLRGIRSTFDNCNSIRFLLESFRVVFSERDVSMHMDFRDELWEVMDSKVAPPKLLIKGRYIGGAEEVLALHEQGRLRPLFQGVPLDQSNGPCEGCAGFRFVVCFECNGSHKVIVIGEEGRSNECPECNENGLILCPLCCST